MPGTVHSQAPCQHWEERWLLPLSSYQQLHVHVHLDIGDTCYSQRYGRQARASHQSTSRISQREKEGGLPWLTCCL